MKKLFIIAIAMVGLSFISCDDKSNNTQPESYTNISYLLDTSLTPFGPKYWDLDTVDAIIVDTTMVVEYYSTTDDFLPRVYSAPLYVLGDKPSDIPIRGALAIKLNYRNTKGDFIIDYYVIKNYPKELMNIHIQPEGIHIKLCGEVYELPVVGHPYTEDLKYIHYLKLTYISIKGGL